MKRGIFEKAKVAILQKILEAKDVLFDKNKSKEEITAEWKKIAAFAKSQGYNKPANYIRSTFMYNERSSAGRRLLIQKKVPLTRAHQLTIEIVGKDSFKRADTSSSASESESDGGETRENADLMAIDESKAPNHSSPVLGKAIKILKRKASTATVPVTGAIENDEMKENRREIMKLKKRKLTLEVEKMEQEAQAATKAAKQEDFAVDNEKADAMEELNFIGF